VQNTYKRTLFTDTIRAMQTDAGSRRAYANAERRRDDHDGLGAEEIAFVQAADHFFLATVGADGWPYVQHRGGPAGFLRILDQRRIGFADFRGNQQFISAGNVATDDRASIIIMDYVAPARLKLIGHLRFTPMADAGADLRDQLVPEGARAQVDRLATFEIVGFDWNCPRHIVPRYTRDEIAAMGGVASSLPGAPRGVQPT